MAKETEGQDRAVEVGIVDAKHQAELQSAKDAVNRVFKLLGVKNVVVVDDELNAAPEVGDLIARYRKVKAENPNRLKTIKRLASVSQGDNQDDIRQDLTEIWNKLDEQQQDDLLVEMGWIPGRKTFAILKDLLIDYNPNFLSFAKWQEHEKELTTPEALAESLILFDLDMSKENGADDEGMRIIKSLLARSSGPCQYGILSHLVSKDNEYNDWQNFAEKYDLRQHQGRFVVISKKHLPDSPMVFAQRLKRAAISFPCNELRQQVERVLDEAFANAKGDSRNSMFMILRRSFFNLLTQKACGSLTPSCEYLHFTPRDRRVICSKLTPK